MIKNRIVALGAFAISGSLGFWMNNSPMQSSAPIINYSHTTDTITSFHSIIGSLVRKFNTTTGLAKMYNGVMPAIKHRRLSLYQARAIIESSIGFANNVGLNRYNSYRADYNDHLSTMQGKVYCSYMPQVFPPTLEILRAHDTFLENIVALTQELALHEHSLLLFYDKDEPIINNDTIASTFNTQLSSSTTLRDIGHKAYVAAGLFYEPLWLALGIGIHNALPNTTFIDYSAQHWLTAHPKITTVGASLAITLLTFIKYNTLNVLYAEQANYDYIQGILIDVASYIRTLKQMANLIENYPELKQLYHLSCNKIIDLFDATQHSAQFNQLLDLLNTPTFTGKPSFFSRTTRVKVAYQLMKAVKDELIPALRQVAQLEAYACIALDARDFENKLPATYL